MRTIWGLALFGVPLLFVPGCPAPTTMPTPDGGAETDAPAMLEPCTVDDDCDDDLYCNGLEACAPGMTGADERGCVDAAEAPCTEGCEEERDRCLGACDTMPDRDGDGHDRTECGGFDCDDDDRMRHAALGEICDVTDHDEDCDPRTFGFRDTDGDSYPDQLCCNEGDDGTRSCGTDCDDVRPNVHPGAAETCDGQDNDCDGRMDEGALRTFYVDADSDGRGDPALPTMTACFVPTGYAEVAGDCDDGESSVHEGGTETCDTAMLDEDCDGDPNPAALCSCSGTGSRACLAPGVCRLGVERCVMGSWGACSISPGTEMCNGLDDDCNGEADEGMLRLCFADPDDDTWAIATAETMMLCPVSGRAAAGGCPIGFTARTPLAPDLDCDESSDLRHPTAAETCNALDDDCDGMIDDGLMLVERYVDLDGDGVSGSPVMRCEGDPGSVAIALDCNEGRTDVYRGAPELCDRVDNNCGLGGAAAGGADAYEDEDDDGYAPPDALCMGGPRPRTDCNDDPVGGGAEDHPGAAEVCSGRDTDCNGTIDDEPAASASCSATNATAGCAGDGDCHMLLCDRGFGDCNADPADGCETTLATSTLHCGGCGLECGAGAPCSNGLCDGIVNVTAAFEHTCVRFSSGAVSCGGENRNFTLGDGTRTDRSSFVRATGVTTATSIVAGQQHTCVVLTGGGITCWGQNAGGALGDGTSVSERSTGVAVVGLAGAAVEVAPGNLMTCARLMSGAVQCWGQNGRGQLGNGTTSTGPTSMPVSVTGITNAISVSAHGSHACAVLADGTARCWGAGDYGVLGNGTTTDSSTPVVVTGLTNARVVRVGNDHACALRMDGSVWCWGRSGSGRLGDGGATDVARTATPVTGVTGATYLSVGDVHACVIRASGQVACWGQNTSGQVGDGTTTNATTPRDVTGITDAVEVAGGGFHTCVLRAGGRMACWGQNTSGQLVNGTLTSSASPVVVTGLHRVAEAVTAQLFACARRTDGLVSCWGDNRDGSLGLGSIGGTRLSPTPTVLSPSVALAASYEWACAIDTTGQLSCWGRIASGATGTPTPVAGIDDAVAIDAGLFHGCVLRESGELWCWGQNGSGVIGNGTTTTAPTPVRAGTLTDVRAFSCSRSNTCAVTGGGYLYCWGQNSFGQIGNGSTGGTFTSPRLVPFAHDYVDVEVTNGVVCARRAIGTLECWGNLMIGGVRTPTTSPRVVTGLPAGDPIESLTLDMGDTAAICTTHASGRAYCWGSDNTTGELGLGHLLPTSNPSTVLRYTDFDAISTGVGVTCAPRDMRRSLACWGAAGRLGDGTSMASSTPVDVVSFP